MLWSTSEDFPFCNRLLSANHSSIYWSDPDMRNTKRGPKFHNVGFGVVRYNTADVMRWQVMRTAS